MDNHRILPWTRSTWSEKNSIVRTVELRVMFFVCIISMALELDRGNLQQGLTDNFLKDLDMDTNGDCCSPNPQGHNHIICEILPVISSILC